MIGDRDLLDGYDAGDTIAHRVELLTAAVRDLVAAQPVDTARAADVLRALSGLPRRVDVAALTARLRAAIDDDTRGVSS